MTKDELVTLLREAFDEQVEQDELTWDELRAQGDEETVQFDKGWQSGFAYAIHLVLENFDD
jgi:hypothetical protein